MEHTSLSDARPADPADATDDGAMTGPDEVARPLAGPTTFDGLYRGEYDRLVRVATLICGSQATAEEVVQGAFLRVHRRWDELDNPAGYLRTSVVNGCRDDRRRQGRFERRKPLLAVEDRATDAPDDALIGARVDLVAAMGSLPSKQRAALVLRFYGGFRESEIAEALEVPGGTVKTLLRRGLERLRKEIQP
jgi:RNA polymerase sigma factor (sigma-70 family)